MAAYIQNIEEKKISLNIEIYKHAWWAIFKIGTQNFDLNKPLTNEILLDPHHIVTQTLIYIHSMETFIYKDLKKASLMKDITKIKTLGPYAHMMSHIIERSFIKKLKNDKDKELAKKYLY